MSKKEITNLKRDIENIINTPSIEINKECVDIYRQSLEEEIEKNFNIRNTNFQKELSKRGLQDSSASMGIQVSLAREKNNAYQEMILKVNNFADAKKKEFIEEKKYLLDFLAQERDKKIAFRLRLIKYILSSGVIMIIFQIFQNDIKSAIRLLCGYLSKITF